ncbi:MAG: sodium:alanine symporter family protein [Clostridia bacterium]|nr:sodium:alanine symporter family protein [Clostridia bacterium]
MLEWFCNNVVSALAPIMLLAAGVFFCIYLKLFFVRHPIKTVRGMLKRESRGGISPFRAVTLALAGTLGVGNIAGVASSIAIGGYGSVFWMWVSALVAMVLKYAEIVLAIRHRRVDRESGEYHGGACYYIEDCLAARKKGLLGKVLGATFAVLCIVNSVTMGSMIQSGAVSGSFSGVFGVRDWIVGTAVALLCIVVITGNARWISGFCEKTVPLMTLCYVALSVAVIAARWKDVPLAIVTIFEDAFNFSSVAGGAFGFLISRQLKAGTMRGLMSNEAGCGTAPTAHAASDTQSPARQGFWGIFEVFVDTILLCTLTAIVIILSGGEVMQYAEQPMMMAIKAYSSVLGAWSEYFMCIAVFLFAFATIVCWAHYGKESLHYISKKRWLGAVFVVAFAVFVFIGAVAAPSYVWLLADLSLGIMTIINLPVLFFMRREVKEETERFFDRQ